MKLLIGTTRGLLLWNDGAVTQLLEGGVYGISKLGEKWYCSHINGPNCAILELDIQGDQLISSKTIMERGPGIHQIDFIGDQLVIADTKYNQICVCSVTEGLITTIVPNGIQTGVHDETHLHLNSVFASGQTLYVMAHNLSGRYNRLSEIYEINLPDYTVRTHYPIDGMACHNIFVDEHGLMFLDSLEGRVIRHGKKVKLHSFLRGLAITADNYFIGSNKKASREERIGGGSIFVFNQQFKQVDEYQIDGVICEIRCLDQPDYSMSNTMVSFPGGLNSG